jgi:hypothetical protein
MITICGRLKKDRIVYWGINGTVVLMYPFYAPGHPIFTHPEMPLPLPTPLRHLILQAPHVCNPHPLLARPPCCTRLWLTKCNTLCMGPRDTNGVHCLLVSATSPSLSSPCFESLAPCMYPPPAVHPLLCISGSPRPTSPHSLSLSLSPSAVPTTAWPFQLASQCDPSSVPVPCVPAPPHNQHTSLRLDRPKGYRWKCIHLHSGHMSPLALACTCVVLACAL